MKKHTDGIMAKNLKKFHGKFGLLTSKFWEEIKPGQRGQHVL